MVLCISGSRSSSLLLVQPGAAIVMASTMVSVLCFRPCSASHVLIAASTRGAPGASQADEMAETQGAALIEHVRRAIRACKPTVQRALTQFLLSDWIAHVHSRRQWMRCMVSLKAGDGRSGWYAPWANEPMSDSAAQQATWFISLSRAGANPRCVGPWLHCLEWLALRKIKLRKLCGLSPMFLSLGRNVLCPAYPWFSQIARLGNDSSNEILLVSAAAILRT